VFKRSVDLLEILSTVRCRLSEGPQRPVCVPPNLYFASLGCPVGVTHLLRFEKKSAYLWIESFGVPPYRNGMGVSVTAMSLFVSRPGQYP
jgi:hypothetical protein